MAAQGDNAEQIAAIIMPVTIAMSRERVGSGETIQYIQIPYKVDINPAVHESGLSKRKG